MTLLDATPPIVTSPPVKVPIVTAATVMVSATAMIVSRVTVRSPFFDLFVWFRLSHHLF